MNADGKCDQPISLAFVGIVVPESAASQYPAYNPAGNLFQQRLLVALCENGLSPSAIYSGRPVPSFPRTRRLWFLSEKVKLESGTPVHLLPFVNLGVFKTLTLGLSNFWNLLLWGWHERRTPQRVVLTYNVLAPHGLATLLAARFIRARAFALIADLWVPGQDHTLASLLRKVDFWLQTKSLSLFDGLVVLTRNIAHDFAPGVPFICVDGAVSRQLLELLARIPEIPLQDGEQTYTLMYSGGLLEFKGIDLLLDAFTRLTGPRYRLLITGKGPLQERVEQAAKADPRISYKGYLTSHSEVLMLYREATLLINPQRSNLPTSRYTFPSKLIEYMATGRPVITTCTAGVEEEYGNFVFLLRDETPEGLANLVSQVTSMSAADRLALGQSARQYVLEHKTWEVQGQRIAQFIRQRVGLR